MTSFKWAIATTLTVAAIAMGSSKVEFTLETGGNNHAAEYEAGGGEWLPYTSGVLDGSTVVADGEDLNWAVRVLVWGPLDGAGGDANRHDDYDPVTFDPTGPGDYRFPLGMANIVYDLVLTDMDDNVIQVGAGGGGVAGFHSTRNDGDTVPGPLPDPLANAAFASVYDVNGNGANGGRLIDAPGDGGPNMDYYWLPSAAGLPAASTAPLGYLIGAGAGYKNFTSPEYIAGVGVYGSLENFPEQEDSDCGIGLVLDHDNPQPIVEGQIDTTGLGPANENDPPIQYKLKVIADPTGNNILHGEVNCGTNSYGPWGSFATQVNEIVNADENNVVAEITFAVEYSAPATEVVGRMLFYNGAYYDGNNQAINLTPNGGTNHDHDDDAIDPTKSPLLPGGGLAQPSCWSNFTLGITGLMFDIKGAATPITSSDFTFINQGRLGTGNTAIAPADFQVRAGEGVDGSDRVVVTFAPGAMVNGWLQVTIGTGFGLQAEDVCYWGSVAYDSGNAPQATFIPVNATDILDARDNTHLVPGSAPVDDFVDYNRDGRVNATDILGARDNTKLNPAVAVGRITR